MTPRTSPASNLLDLAPRRLVASEPRDDGLIVLLVPKFRGRLLGSWLTARLAKPVIRVKLDVYGSFVWNQCDGRTTVFQIAERMRSAYGDATEPVYDRVGRFVKTLVRDKFLTIEPGGTLG